MRCRSQVLPRTSSLMASAASRVPQNSVSTKYTVSAAQLTR